MRILAALYHAHTEATSEAAVGTRLMLRWLAEAGHECRVLCTAGFVGEMFQTLDAHLGALDVPVERHGPSKQFERSVRKPANRIVGRPTLGFPLDGVRVTMLLTAAPVASPAAQYEQEQWLFLLDEALTHFRPDVLLVCDGHPAEHEAMRRARRHGVKTLFVLYDHTHLDRAFFEPVDRVLACSPYLSTFYREQIGLASTGLVSPIAWTDVEAPGDLRRYLTFVDPTLARGLMMFARVAAMLGASRPDIPILVVPWGGGVGRLNAIPGLDFRNFPQIVAAPTPPAPVDLFALTRVLIAPSAAPEPFGRLVAEGLTNGIPPVVSDRGALPETVGTGGRVIPLPGSLTETSETLPREHEARPWVEAICELWDSAPVYAAASAQARAAARARFDEPELRRSYIGYVAALEDFPPPFEA